MPEFEYTHYEAARSTTIGELHDAAGAVITVQGRSVFVRGDYEDTFRLEQAEAIAQGELTKLTPRTAPKPPPLEPVQDNEPAKAGKK